MNKKNKKIITENKLILKMMDYKIGSPASEQLNELSYIKKAASETLDYMTGGQGLIPDALQSGEGTTAKWLRGESGIVPGDQTQLKKDIKDYAKAGLAVVGGLIVAPTLDALTRTLCGTGILDGLSSLYKGLQGKIPQSKNNVTSSDKKNKYRFRLRYYSPGKATSNNMFGIPTGLEPGKSFPVSGHVGVMPDDNKLNKLIKNGNSSAYWTDWGPGESGAEEMGNLKSHKFTGSFSRCKPDSKACGKGAEGDFYIYLTKDQALNYYKQQPKFRSKKHSKWPGFEIKTLGIKIPSMPNFCDPKGYHLAKNNCADATSAVLGLPKKGSSTTPYDATVAALNKFPNKNADGESTSKGTSGTASNVLSKKEKPKPKPTIKQAWDSNNKGVQSKYKTFEDFKYAALYYQKTGKNPQALEDKPPYSYEK